MTRWNRSVTVPPERTLPISLSEAKRFVRDTTPADDTTIASLIRAAFAEVEQNLDRAVLRQTRRWDWTADPEPPLVLEPFAAGSLSLRRAVDGEWQDLDSEDFTEAAENGYVFPGPDGFPHSEGDPVGAWRYRAEAVCGWEAVPEDLLLAVLVQVNDRYRSRGIRDIGRPKTMPWEPVQHYSWRMA